MVRNFENWNRGYGIVFIGGMDGDPKSGWWGMGGVNATPKTHPSESRYSPKMTPIRKIELSVGNKPNRYGEISPRHST